MRGTSECLRMLHFPTPHNARATGGGCYDALQHSAAAHVEGGEYAGEQLTFALKCMGMIADASTGLNGSEML